MLLFCPSMEITTVTNVILHTRVFLSLTSECENVPLRSDVVTQIEMVFYTSWLS